MGTFKKDLKTDARLLLLCLLLFAEKSVLSLSVKLEMISYQGFQLILNSLRCYAIWKSLLNSSIFGKA